MINSITRINSRYLLMETSALQVNKNSNNNSLKEITTINKLSVQTKNLKIMVLMILQHSQVCREMNKISSFIVSLNLEVLINKNANNSLANS